MITLFNIVITVYFCFIIVNLFLKNDKVSLVFLSTVSSTILSIINLSSGKLLASITLVSLAIFLSIYSKDKITIDLYTKIFVLLLFAFVLYMLLSLIFSSGTDKSYGSWKFTQFIVLGVLPSMAFLFCKSDFKNSLATIERIMINFSMIISIYLIVNFILNSGLQSLNNQWFERQSVGDANQIWITRFLGIGLLIIHSDKFRNKSLKVYGMSVLFITAAFLTGSKIILFFILPLTLLYKITQVRKSKNLIGIITFISLITILFFVVLRYVNMDSLLRRFSLESNTTFDRLDMWRSVLNYYYQNNRLFFGSGLGTVGIALTGFSVRTYPHNLFVEILFELGILGLLIFMLLIFLGFTLVINNIDSKKNSWVIYAFILQILYSMTSGDLASNIQLFQFLALLILFNKYKVKGEVIYEN